MAEKKRKSKEQQRKDMAKLAAGAAAAGFAANRIAKKAGGRSKKSKRTALIVGILVFIIIAASGAMYYYDVPPLNGDYFNGQFKSWYMSPDSFVQSDGNLQIRYLDVGQGDSILIQLPDGKNMLIDSGKNNSETEDKIIKSITDLGIDTIDYGILTHTDSDHSGGFDKVVASDEITFKTFYIPLIKSKLANDKVDEWYAQADYLPKDEEPAGFEIQSVETQVYADFMQAVLDEGSEVLFSYEGMQIKGDGYVFDFYNPTYNEYKKISTAKQKNNVSPIMILRFNDKKIMFTGDCDDAESNFIETAAKGDGALYDVDVLKVAHHGGRESTSQNFLNVAKPEYSVISVGENSYNHPTDEVISRLNSVNSKIFTTQDKGDIILTLSGNKMGWAFEKTDSSYGSASDYDAEEVSVASLMQRIVPTYNTSVFAGGVA